MGEEIPQEITDIQDIPEKETDSYDELAKGAEVAEPPKRGRGRPKGAKNKVKPPSVSESEEEEPPPPPPRRKKPKAAVAPLDVEFDEGYGGACQSTCFGTGPPSKPVRIKKTPAAASPLMERGPSARAKKQSFFTLVAEAAQQHGAREQETRRNFYERFLPM